MKYSVIPTNQFKKDMKLLKKRGYDLSKISTVIKLLSDGIELPERNKDHALVGNYDSYRECHISPDWILIYRIKNENLILSLSRTGTHSDLF